MTTAPLDLGALRERCASLNAEREAAQSSLDAARAGLIVGSSKASQVVSAQNLLDALEGALGTLDAQIAEARAQADLERAEAYREGLLAQLVQGARQAEKHRQACTDTLEAALTDLAPYLESAFAELYELSDLRKAWAQNLGEFDRALPTPGTALGLVSAQTDLGAIRTKALPGDWHEGLTTDAVASAVFFLPAELHLLWKVYVELKRQGRLPAASQV